MNIIDFHTHVYPDTIAPKAADSIRVFYGFGEKAMDGTVKTLLERGDAPLEQAMTLFEEGAVLLRQCSAALDAAEQKVTLLTAGEDGQPMERGFGGEDS